MQFFLGVGLAAAGTLVLALWGGRVLENLLRNSVLAELRRAARAPGILGRRPGTWARRLAFAALVPAILLVGMAVGRPLVGLAGLILLPALVRGAVAWRKARLARVLENDALAFLHGLRGLLAAGLSFPTAIFVLTRDEHPGFAATLAPFLSHFEGGRPLAHCLRRFREKVGLMRVEGLLVSLESAYQRGLPLLPLLDSALPGLESEARAEERIAGIRSQALAQAALACAVPWLVWGALAVLQPELFQSFRTSGWFWWVVGGALGIEAVGAWVLWRVTIFL